MKLAFISDIHGNLTALENCIKFLDDLSVDRTFFLGDAVGYLLESIEVLEVLINSDIPCIKGNHEAMILGEIPKSIKKEKVYKLDAVSSKMPDEYNDAIKKWPDHLKTTIDGRKYFLVHGSPSNPYKGYIYPDTNLDKFKGMEADILLMGHTHYPFVKKTGDKTIINVGSVGLPRDVGNLSCLCVIDTQKEQINHYRIPFVVEEVINKLNEKDVHPSVVECLNRKKSKFTGTLV